MIIEKKTLLYKLEALRGVAACLIILFHSPFHYREKPFGFVSNSYLFVDFFFILSGFVMALSYSSRINEGMPFKSYLILRLGRIYPLHIFMLIVWLAYILFKQTLFGMGFGETDLFEENHIGSFMSQIFLVNSVGIYNYSSWNSVAWSIGAEFFAYMFFYFASLTFDKNKTLLVPVIISAMAYGMIVSLNRPSLDISYDYGFLRCLGAFYLGVFTNRFTRFSEIQKCFERHILEFEVVCISAIVLFVSYAEQYFFMTGFVIIAFVLCIYIFSAANSGLFGKMLLSRPLQVVGQRSYSIYMAHPLIVVTIGDIFQYILKYKMDSPWGAQSFVMNLFIVAATIGISKYTYSYIEVFFRNKSRSMVML